MTRLSHLVEASKTALCAVTAMALVAGCAPLPVAERAAPRAMVEDSAVRSVVYPEPPAACRAVPCAGPVPAEYVAAFKRDLEAAGFDVVDGRGGAAPVLRIRVDHIATTPTECDMHGAIYIADNLIEVKRSFIWRPGIDAKSSGAGGAKPLSPDMKSYVLRTCLAAFAATVKDALATSASPDAANFVRR